MGPTNGPNMTATNTPGTPAAADASAITEARRVVLARAAALEHLTCCAAGLTAAQADPDAQPVPIFRHALRVLESWRSWSAADAALTDQVQQLVGVPLPFEVPAAVEEARRIVGPAAAPGVGR